MLPDPHALLPVAYRAASRVVRSRLMAEEAGERAMHLLTLATLRGCAPHSPEAWLRVVARRSACAILRSEWARIESVGHEVIQERQAPYREPRRFLGDLVREHLDGTLSPRQRDAIDAALHNNGTRAAARSCGMQPRDFRRYLSAISRKARSALAAHAADDAFADDAAVQFRLGS